MMETICVSQLRLLQALRNVVLRTHAGQQINDEAKDVGRKNDCDHPLKDRGLVLMVRPASTDEAHSQTKLHQDKDEFDPERNP